MVGTEEYGSFCLCRVSCTTAAIRDKKTTAGGRERHWATEDWGEQDIEEASEIS